MKFNTSWKKEKLTVKLKCQPRQNEEGFTWPDEMVCTQYRNLCTSESFFKQRKTAVDRVMFNYIFMYIYLVLSWYFGSYVYV